MNAVKKSRLLWVLTLITVLGLAVFLTACNNNNDDDDTTGDTNANNVTGDQPEVTPPPLVPDVADEYLDVGDEVAAGIDAFAELRALEAQFPFVYNNPSPIIPGGTMIEQWGMTTPFIALFLPTHSTESSIAGIGDVIIPPLTARTDSLELIIGPDGHDAPVIVESVDLDAMAITLAMRDGVQIFWQDGVELTLDDLVFAYYIISHPDYTGTRFDDGNGTRLVVGAQEFKAGEVDYIAGLELSEDGRRLVIRYIDLPPGIMYSMWNSPIARHHFEGVAIGDIQAHPHAREEMIGFGPFLLETVVPGESIVLVANENYWRGRPHLDRYMIVVVDPEFATEAMRIGQADIAGFRLTDWPYHNDMDNVAWLGRIGNGLGPLMHFTLGEMHQDEDGTRRIEPRDDGHPITDPIFRRAMGYAIDRLFIDQEFNNGFGRPATSILSPFNSRDEWFLPDSFGLSLFDLDRANEILDEAGYVWGPDGFRLDLQGNPFHVNFAVPHTTAMETIFPMHQQNMADIGIDFRLYGDSWTDFNHIITYMQTVTGIHDDPRSKNSDMHIFQMNWTYGANPSPQGLWRYHQGFNVGRFYDSEMQAAIDDIDSIRSWDPDFQTEAFLRFNRAFDRTVPAITASWSVGLILVNNRVANYTRDRSRYLETSLNWHLLGLTAENPYVDSQR